MKILVVSHNCVLAASQERLVEFARLADEKPVLLVPPRNLETQGMVRLEREHDERYEIVKGRPLFSTVLGQRYLQYYPFLWTLLRRARPDIIVLHEEPWSLASFQTMLIRNTMLPGAKVIVESEQNIRKKFPPPFSAFERYVLRHADAMIARSGEVKEVLRRKGFRGEIAVVPNGLDVNLFRKKDSGALKKKLGLERFVVGYMGRMEEEKGVEDLLRAAAMAAPPVNLLLVGEGKHKPALQKTAASLPLRGKVVWHPAVEQKEAPDFLNCMDALALPSRTTATWKEQFGRVLTEAMACEVAVIGSDSGAIPEVIGDAGIVYPEGNVEELKNSIEKIIAEPDARARLIRKGLERAREKYSWRAAARLMMDLFEKVI